MKIVANSGSRSPSDATRRAFSYRSLKFILSRFVCLLLAFAVNTCLAQTFTVLHTFKGSPDGADPLAGVVFDSAGNLYGTTMLGGLNDAGSVFKLSKNGREVVLHNFTTETLDGSSPVAKLVRTSNGNLFGVTSRGGNNTAGGPGTVFMLDPSGDETILYAFTGGADGSLPLSDVTRDKKGNLYGTTFDTNGTSPAGVVFMLTASDQIPWKDTVLHTFTNIPDGAGPVGGLLMDSKGTLYGTTEDGGSHGCGEIFEISKTRYTQLFSFCGDGSDRTTGKNPQSALILDAAGNLYGTTPGGGVNQDGVIYKLVHAVAGTWTEEILYPFCPKVGCPDGSFPEAPLVMDSQGNLYGTTSRGGAFGFGVVFELTSVGGVWVETVLHSFNGGTDGGKPFAGLALDSQGNLYGTASVGGDLSLCFGIGCGTVFKITP